MTDFTPTAITFVTDRHLAILSTHTKPKTGADAQTGEPDIHSVPVGFTLEGGIVRIITGDGTQKVVNAERGGQATVAQVDGPRWITLIGTTSVNRDPDAVAHAVDLYAKRYRQPSVNPKRVVIEIAVERVMGSSGMKQA